MCTRAQCQTEISLRKPGHVFSFVKFNFRGSFFFTNLAQNTPSFPKSHISSVRHEMTSITHTILKKKFFGKEGAFWAKFVKKKLALKLNFTKEKTCPSSRNSKIDVSPIWHWALLEGSFTFKKTNKKLAFFLK